MTSKFPKQAYQLILGLFILAFTFAACNNDGEKKDEKPAMEEKKMDAPPPMQDTTKMDTVKGKTKPTAPGE